MFIVRFNKNNNNNNNMKLIFDRSLNQLMTRPNKMKH